MREMVRSRKHRSIFTALAAALGAFASLGGIGLAEAGGATQSLTLNPVADARVEEAHPATNYGRSTRLKSDGGTGARIQSVLRFDLSGVTGTVQSAKLRLRTPSNGTKDGPAVYPTDGDWTEGGVTWKTRPAASGFAVADLGAIPAGTWVEVDVTALVTGGSVNILLKQPGTNGVDFYSREGKYKPELIVTAAEDTSSPPPPPPPSSSEFPRGIWVDSDVPSSELADVKGLGFGFAQVDPDRAQLDRVWAGGLRAVVWLGNYDDDNCRWNWSDEELSFKINATKDHPAIAYYFIADEPHSAASGGCASAPDDIRARDALVKFLHPGVPTFITENRRADFANLANTTDFMGLIRYPCSYSSGCVMSKITETINAANAAGIEHYWGVPQVFKEPSGGYYRAPSPSELKEIFATWEAEGSRIEGYLFYTWGRNCCGDDIGLADLSELWDTVKAENGVSSSS